MTRPDTGEAASQLHPLPTLRRNPVKPLLWTVLLVAIVANVSLNLMDGREGLHIALSVVSGVVVLASGVRLWMLRTRREYEY
ncbi:hypothetical protein AMK09_00030 [Streptomyces sp. CB02488]|uniref:hypothetical protein n=1 Tax=Streptomyces sp. CB02488 TaxID=1703920 RepID=UPI00093D7DB7|nr:hypothetical protein [Streptomyces sp. CB02488]OKK24640.1 hypothetical protein AMK09_00030 [Streptomyces sp. CB02488]